MVTLVSYASKSIAGPPKRTSSIAELFQVPGQVRYLLLPVTESLPSVSHARLNRASVIARQPSVS